MIAVDVIDLQHRLMRQLVTTQPTSDASLTEGFEISAND